MALAVLVLGPGSGVLAGATEGFTGTWSGTWTGGTGGEFQMTIAEAEGAGISGSIRLQPADGQSAYTADLTSVAVESGALTVTFDPPDGQSQVTMKGRLLEGKAEGTYDVLVHEQIVETGTWEATAP
jgi:hypothetical protein